MPKDGSLLPILANALTRRVSSLFPGHFEGIKHNHYLDFGYPETVTFELLLHMYRRNALARAAVLKTIDKVWQDTPKFREEEAAHPETPLEVNIRQHIGSIRGWQMLKLSNARALVGGWSATILLFEDGQPLSAPVSIGQGADITFLAGMLPVWRDQLQVSAWNLDELSPDYGKPTEYTFTEQALVSENGISNRPRRSVKVHPDRVVVWSSDGTPFGTSMLEAGYNDLISIEKVAGAGGEAFWKNAKGGAVLKLDEEMEIEELKRALNVSTNAELITAMNEQLEDWQRGYDKALLLQNMSLETPNIALPSPEWFRRGPLENFAASVGIPTRILVGMQSGERASTEDAREWSQTCMARREDVTHPSLLAFVERLEAFGLVPERDWYVDQPDLTEATQAQKVQNAQVMADIDQKAAEPVFTVDEYRAAAGFGPLTAEQKKEFEDRPEPAPVADPFGQQPQRQQPQDEGTN